MRETVEYKHSSGVRSAKDKLMQIAPRGQSEEAGHQYTANVNADHVALVSSHIVLFRSDVSAGHTVQHENKHKHEAISQASALRHVVTAKDPTNRHTPADQVRMGTPATITQ